MTIYTHADAVDFAANDDNWWLLTKNVLLDYVCAHDWILRSWLTAIEDEKALQIIEAIREETDRRKIPENFSFMDMLEAFHGIFFENFGYSFTDIKRDPDEEEQEAGEEAGLLFTHTISVNVEAESNNKKLFLFANSKLNPPSWMDDISGAKVFDLTDTIENVNLKGLEVRLVSGVDTLYWDLNGIVGDDETLHFEFTIEDGKPAVKLNRFTEARFIAALEDWDMLEHKDQFLKWSRDKTGRAKYVGKFMHRCLHDVALGIDERDVVVDEYSESWSTHYQNHMFLCGKDSTDTTGRDEVTFENPYNESFLIVKRHVLPEGFYTDWFGADMAVDNISTGWAEESLTYITTYIVPPGSAETYRADTNFGGYVVPSVFQFFVLSGYDILKGIPSSFKSDIRDAGIEGGNAIQYFKDNEYKLRSWERGKIDMWDVMEEYDDELYDFRGDMGITTRGIKYYKVENDVLSRSQLPDDFKDKDESDFGYIGIILFAAAVCGLVYYLVKKGYIGGGRK